METKQLITLVVALVVVGGGVWYFSSGNPGGVPVEEGVVGTNTAATPATEAEGSATLADLMMRDGAYRCDVELKASGGADSSGTVYIGNERMRGDFTSVMNGSTIESHMISMDGYVYTWSDMMPQGVKMQVSADGTTAGSQGGLDASSAVDYHCASWAIDANRFVLPDNVTFMTFGGAQ